jgi:uncharacterized protein with PIN domain
VNLVDSSAWLAYFAGERSAAYFAKAIEDEELLIVPSICIYEVFKVVLRERGDRYGPFENHAKITQQLKDVMRAEPGWDRLTYPQREALEMVAHKIGRMLNGDPTYEDNVVDILGYSDLMLRCMRGKEQL